MSAILVVPLAVALTGLMTDPGGEVQSTAESRALAYLAQEVPHWARENKCYSCHNNGDAARALYTAVQLSYPVPPKALADTSRWLERPGSGTITAARALSAIRNWPAFSLPRRWWMPWEPVVSRIARR